MLFRSQHPGLECLVRGGAAGRRRGSLLRAVTTRDRRRDRASLLAVDAALLVVARDPDEGQDRNLDHVTGEQIIKLLFDLREQNGTSLILVTHDRSLAERCDRMAEVLDGKIVAEATS